MADIKVNIGDSKTKKTYNKTLTAETAQPFLGRKIGDVVKGDLLELPGYELQIVGGSDNSGFPMRRDVQGSAKKKILIVGGIGLRNTDRNGKKLRKTVAGNTIYEKTSQINLKVTKWGKGPIEAPTEAPTTKEDAPAETKKE